MHLLNKRCRAREKSTCHFLNAYYVPDAYMVHIHMKFMYILFNSKAITWVANITPILNIKKLRSRHIPYLLT